jgi:phosphatidylinositol dimannoside acyltransferase
VISAPAAPRLARGGRALLSRHVTDWGFAAGWLMVRAMPDSFARNAFDAGARYAARRGGPEQLRKNLARVIGVAPAEVRDALIRASLMSYARYWREVFRLPTMDHQALGRLLADGVEGEEHVRAALDAGRGAVLALPHSGNWDMAGVWLVHAHGTFTTVAERLKPESLYRRFIAYREGLGFEVLPLTGAAGPATSSTAATSGQAGHRPPYEVLAERLRANRVVCLMAERDLTRSGVQVEFFSEPTRMPAGPARLAIETGAALLPVHCWYEPDGWGCTIHSPLDTRSGVAGAITQALADRFAAGIAGHPADWHMMQPQWLADLSAERRAHLAGDNP